jgi:hypothetical protein
MVVRANVYRMYIECPCGRTVVLLWILEYRQKLFNFITSSCNWTDDYSWLETAMTQRGEQTDAGPILGTKGTLILVSLSRSGLGPLLIAVVLPCTFSTVGGVILLGLPSPRVRLQAGGTWRRPWPARWTGENLMFHTSPTVA